VPVATGGEQPSHGRLVEVQRTLSGSVAAVPYDALVIANVEEEHSVFSITVTVSSVITVRLRGLAFKRGFASFEETGRIKTSPSW
jgi:hypothetical protein